MNKTRASHHTYLHAVSQQPNERGSNDTGIYIDHIDRSLDEESIVCAILANIQCVQISSSLYIGTVRSVGQGAVPLQLPRGIFYTA